MSTIESEFAMELGNIIKTRRQESGISLRALARRAGISASYLHKIESGGSEPTASKLQRLAQALEVPVSVLFPAA